MSSFVKLHAPLDVDSHDTGEAAFGAQSSLPHRVKDGTEAPDTRHASQCSDERGGHQSSEDSPHTASDLLKMIRELDAKMKAFFHELSTWHKQAVLTEMCNHLNNNRTVFHYASMYGLQETLNLLFEAYRRYEDHRHFNDKENRQDPCCVVVRGSRIPFLCPF